MARRAPFGVPVHAALLGLALLVPTAWHGAAAQRAARPERPLRLTFRQSFAGVDREARCVWEGWAVGDARGRLTAAFQQVESPFQAAEPVWHVRAHVTLVADPDARSFTAELEGMVDWKAGVAHLSGVVTEGWLKGAWVQLTDQLVDLDAKGSLQLTPVLASR